MYNDEKRGKSKKTTATRINWWWKADMRGIIGQVGFIVIDHQGGESRDRVVRDPCR